MKGWFWRSAFGPIPSAATGAVRTNGLPGQVMTAKKKRLTDASVAPTHGISARCRSRWRHSASDAQPVASSAQKRIEPSSAAHRLIALMNGGVVVALFSATYSTLKSWAIRLVTIAAQPTPAAAKEPMTARRALTVNRVSPPRPARTNATAA